MRVRFSLVLGLCFTLSTCFNLSSGGAKTHIDNSPMGGTPNNGAAQAHKPASSGNGLAPHKDASSNGLTSQAHKEASAGGIGMSPHKGVGQKPGQPTNLALQSHTYKPTEFIRDHNRTRNPKHSNNSQSSDGVDGLDDNTSPVWERDGDIQLGVVLSMTDYHQEAPMCGLDLRRPSALLRLESMVFAVEEINRRRDILPGIRLGFVVMDDCSRDAAALLRALRFIPPPPCGSSGSGDNSNGDLASTTTTSSDQGSTSQLSSPASTTIISNSYVRGGVVRKSFSVVGVIGAELSESSLQMAALLSPFRVPQLSYASSSTFLR